MPYLEYLVLVLTAALVVGNARDTGASRLAAITVFIVVVIPFMFLRSTGRGTLFGDFDKAYYPAALAALRAPETLYACAHPDGMCFVNIPIVSFMFAPLSLLTRPEAQAMFTVVGIAALIMAIPVLSALTGATGWQRYAIVLLFVLNGPLYYSVRLANLTHIVLALVVVALMCLVSAREIAGGILLAVSGILKPPLLIWLPYFIIRQRWRAAAAMAATLTLVVAASLACFGIDLHVAWIGQFIDGANARPIGAYNVQSINGFLVRLSRGGTLANWQPVEVGIGYHVSQVLLNVLICTLAAIGMWAGRLTGRAEELRDFSIVLCTMLLISPISWTHYYCLLLIPAAASVTNTLELPRTPWWTAAMGVALILVSLPVMLWIPKPPLLGTIVSRILISHYVFGAFLLQTVLVCGAVRMNVARSHIAS